MEAEYIQSCNCDWGCPCNFDALPTHGSCEALVAYRVKKGKFGDTKLDGVVFAEGLWWPKAIHEGNGVGALYIDENTTPEQRKAVEAVFSGKHGGGVFEIFPKTWTKKLPTKVGSKSTESERSAPRTFQTRSPVRSSKEQSSSQTGSTGRRRLLQTSRSGGWETGNFTRGTITVPD